MAHKYERYGPQGLPSRTSTHTICQAIQTRSTGTSKLSQWRQRAFYDPEQAKILRVPYK